jgi:hypothetical protein
MPKPKIAVMATNTATVSKDLKLAKANSSRIGAIKGASRSALVVSTVGIRRPTGKPGTVAEKSEVIEIALFGSRRGCAVIQMWTHTP